eukprot:s6681_g1.t1
MPPISVLRTLFALATTRRVPGLDGRMRELPRNQCLMFLDIKKAHFWADARRRILVELPEEAGVDTRKFVGLLRKSLYGTRDALANWEATILRVMNLLGFIQGRSNSCLYFHAEREIRVEVHGDDFTGLGSKEQLQWFAQELGKHWTERVDEIDEAELLNPEDASRYRSVSMRLAYLSQDRPDLQVLAKELAQS